MLCLLALLAGPVEDVRLLPESSSALVTFDAASVREALGDAGGLPELQDVPTWIARYTAGIDLLLAGPLERSRAAIITLPPGQTAAGVGLLPPQADGWTGPSYSGLPASYDHRGATLLQLAAGRVGVLRPADEDKTAAWAASLQQPASGPGVFLVEAARTDAALVLALALEGQFDAAGLAAFLQADAALQGRQLEAAAPNARGLVLAIRKEDLARLAKNEPASMYGRIAFTEPPAADPDAVRDLVDAVLSEMHLAMPEIAEARVQRNGADVLLTMPLREATMERVASLAMPAGYQPLQPLSPEQLSAAVGEASQENPFLNPPGGRDPAPAASAGRPAASSDPPAAAASQTASDPKLAEYAEATAEYMKDLTTILDQFERAAEASKPEQRTAAWIGRFANRMTRLDERNVDRRALAYGRQAEDVMRRLTASLQGQRVAVETAEKQLVYRYDVEPVYAPLRFNVFGGYNGVSVGVPIRGGFSRGVAGPGYGTPGYYGGGNLGVGGAYGVRGPLGFGVQTPGVLPPVTQVGTRRRVLDSNVKTIRREQAQAIREGAEERGDLWTDLRTQENDVIAELRDAYGEAWPMK